MSIEIDGAVLPPNIVSKLEIFMLNVLRFRQEMDSAELVDEPGFIDTSLSRKIVK